MDEIQEKMAGLEEETSIVKDLYDLVEKYQVPVPPEDNAVYQVGRLHRISKAGSNNVLACLTRRADGHSFANKHAKDYVFVRINYGCCCSTSCIGYQT